MYRIQNDKAFNKKILAFRRLFSPPGTDLPGSLAGRPQRIEKRVFAARGRRKIRAALNRFAWVAGDDKKP